MLDQLLRLMPGRLLSLPGFLCVSASNKLVLRWLLIPSVTWIFSTESWRLLNPLLGNLYYRHALHPPIDSSLTIGHKSEYLH